MVGEQNSPVRDPTGESAEMALEEDGAHGEGNLGDGRQPEEATRGGGTGHHDQESTT